MQTKQLDHYVLKLYTAVKLGAFAGADLTLLGGTIGLPGDMRTRPATVIPEAPRWSNGGGGRIVATATCSAPVGSLFEMLFGEGSAFAVRLITRVD